MRTRLKRLGFSFLLPAILPLAVHGQNHHTSAVPSLAAQSQNFQFEHLSTAQGLSDNNVKCIFQDSRGFLWFGTQNGLNRYDGYTFKVFTHDPQDSTTISNNSIWKIYEDRSQNLWIGTNNGLNKFDHATEIFTRYLHDPNDPQSLSEGVVRAIHESRHGGSAGTLWIGTWWSGGQDRLSKFDWHTGKFTRYQHQCDIPNIQGENMIWFILGDHAGNLWMGTEASGVVKLDPRTEKFLHYLHDPQNPNSLSDKRIWSGYQDRSGIFWFGTFNERYPASGPGGLNKLVLSAGEGSDPRSEKFTRYEHHPDDPSSIRSNFIRCITGDHAGNLWIGTQAGVSKFDPQTEVFTSINFVPPTGPERNSNTPETIYEDRSQVLWIGTVNNGVFRLDRKPPKFTHYRHDPQNSQSLSHNDIRFLYEDKSGQLWISIHNGGVDRFDPDTETFAHYRRDPRNPRSLGSNSVRSLYEDKLGALWFGTADRGLDKLDRTTGTFTHYRHDPARPSSLSDNIVVCINEDQFGGLWIGTMLGGLNKFDRRTEIFTHFKPSPDTSRVPHAVCKIHEDRFHNFWVAMNGLRLFDIRTGKFTAIKKLPPELLFRPRYFYEDRSGTLWVACNDLGLLRVDTKEQKLSQFKILPEALNGTAYNTVQTIFDDRTGMLWVGTQNGLHKFDPRREKFMAHYYERDGLPGSEVLKIVEDDHGNLWVLANRGLAIFNENLPPGQRFKHFDRNDGVDNASIYSPYTTPLLKSQRSEIYWSGTNGLHRFYPKNQNRSSQAPPIRLTEFRLFNEAVKLDTAIAEIKTIHLNYDQDFFSFAFAALDFTNPLKNQYAYKLEGLDHDWVEAGNKHEANYTHVPHGEYVFRVKGSNADGVWNEDGVAVQIIISPPFWKTWWFRSLVAVAIIGVLAFAYNYRVSKLLEIERTRLRLRIARDLHDDVGSSLSSIALTAELLQKESATDSLADRRLTRVHETAQKLSRNLKEIVWAIDPQRDKFGDLLLHMKEAAAELLGQKGIAYTFDLPSEELPQSLKMEFRRNLFLIYKELLHNVVKHAEATQVEITLTRTNGMLQLQVADNGKGFREESVGNGSALKSMRARAGELHGKLEIGSGPERGTRVTLSVNCK
jgi:ligand-binding sensor domain-containing protein